MSHWWVGGNCTSTLRSIFGPSIQTRIQTIALKKKKSNLFLRGSHKYIQKSVGGRFIRNV
ncbi:unnamed protein product [Tenebrio molitor]|nr:unnamed protein product [Tenebrio molitor]